MAILLNLSCDSDKTETGPTLVHSTGVENFKIPEEVVRILQDNLTNDLLSDDSEGVLCQENPQRILEILGQNGFTLQNESTDDGKTVWVVVQNTEQTDETNPTTNDENQGDANEEEQVTNDQEEE